jgi:DegV family protein with EDD domain
LSLPDNRVKITADSTCDIGSELAKQYSVGIVPLYVSLGNKSYRDGVDIHPDMIFEYYDKTGELAKTSAPSVEDYFSLFSSHKNLGGEIVHISISEKLSASYLNAVAAAERVGGVHVVDSRNLSSATGLLVLLASELASQGKSAGEIVAVLESEREKLDASFVIDTLEYLRKGGRCSSLAAFGANLLQLRPSIKVTDGAMTVGKKYRGGLKKALMNYIDDTFEDISGINKKRVFITHSGCDPELIGAVRERIAERIQFEEVLETRAGATITCHCGANTLGVLFFNS